MMKWKIMLSHTLKDGRNIKGFFALFDVLGYSKMIESMKDNLEGLIDIYTNTLMDIDDLALSLEGHNKLLLLAPIETKSFVFSDTIVLYQDMPKGPVALQAPTINVFLGEACYLLRLAFERGIPLRGAVSYGDYYIQEDRGCFIGYPVIEAHNIESKQNWSGATICKSAWDKLYSLHNESTRMEGEWRGFDLRGFFSPLNNPLWVKYPIPYESSNINGIALCWHDVILDFMCLNKISGISTNDFGQYVREKFEAHGKTVDNNDDKTKKKIENTAAFLGIMQTQYSLLKKSLSGEL
jgi:hypothetical protein